MKTVSTPTLPRAGTWVRVRSTSSLVQTYGFPAGLRGHVNEISRLAGTALVAFSFPYQDLDGTTYEQPPFDERHHNGIALPGFIQLWIAADDLDLLPVDEQIQIAAAEADHDRRYALLTNLYLAFRKAEDRRRILTATIHAIQRDSPAVAQSCYLTQIGPNVLALKNNDEVRTLLVAAMEAVLAQYSGQDALIALSNFVEYVPDVTKHAVVQTACTQVYSSFGPGLTYNLMRLVKLLPIEDVECVRAAFADAALRYHPPLVRLIDDRLQALHAA